MAALGALRTPIALEVLKAFYARVFQVRNLIDALVRFENSPATFGLGFGRV
jgi:hypothetical protein